jgi:hypothetical protein
MSPDHVKASVMYQRGVLKESAKENAKSSGSRKSSVLLSYHGGSVYHSSQTKAIFWGPEWSNPSFAGDKISGMDQFFEGFGGSKYAYSGTEYSDTSGYVTANSTYLGHVIDTSAAPSHALSIGSAISEACKIANNAPLPNTLYLIYTSTGAGNVNYCAWHTWGKCTNGASIQVAYMPNLDSMNGCLIDDSQSGHSRGLSSIANVTAHELMETITDPTGNAWYDDSGSENGDKCAWSFSDNLSIFSNGSQWKLQMEWSNQAYTSGTGLANLSGEKGCID